MVSLSPLINVENIDLSRHLLIAERFTERVVKTTNAAQRIFIAQQIDQARMPLPGRRNHHEHLPARLQLRQAPLEVGTECLQLKCR
jgi:hypothetical protein